mmetsp:Transcript_31553/g.60255  ORF Transcript_31553/g.60255 Transcript_31553/m.60255 type:complete len:303 (+) Transcript_31553:803-1711(+)
MPIHVNQVFVLALFVNGRKVMLPGIETEILRPQEGHGTFGRFLITHVPSHDCRIDERFFSSLFGVVLPYVTEVGYHEALVGFDCSSTSCGGTSEKCRGDTSIVPTSFELSEIFFRKQITGFAGEYRIPILVLRMHERSWKYKTTSSLPILRRRPRNIRKPIRLRRIKRNNRSVTLKLMLLEQFHILLRNPIVLIENKPVRFHGLPPPGYIHLQLRIIALIQKEFTVGHGPFPARLSDHIAQCRQEVIPPELSRVLIFRFAQFVAYDVTIGPPFGFIRFDVFVAVESGFVGVVRVERSISLER